MVIRPYPGSRVAPAPSSPAGIKISPQERVADLINNTKIAERIASAVATGSGSSSSPAANSAPATVASPDAPAAASSAPATETSYDDPAAAISAPATAPAEAQ